MALIEDKAVYVRASGINKTLSQAIVDGDLSGSGVPDATDTIKGKLKLAGDLGGTADLPTVPGLANKLDIPTGTAEQYLDGLGEPKDFPDLDNATKFTTRVYNQTGSTIPKGSVVYINGAHGNLPTIALAQANSESGSTKTYGIVNADISDNFAGVVTNLGLIVGLNTFSIPAGSALWLSPTIAGAITTTKPTQPNHSVFIGFCSRSHPDLGEIQINIQNGFELEELHNVLISSVADAQFLRYENSTSLWKNHSLTKSDVGLSNVDNTSDENKPISTATQTALNLKANLASPTFTGTPAAPTPADGDNTTKIATTEFVQNAIALASGKVVEIFNTEITIGAVASSLTGLAYFRAPFDLTINDVALTLFNKGSVASGTLSIDLEKNSSPDTVGMSTIFSVQPSINFATDPDYTVRTGTLSSAVILQGQWIRLDVTSIPTNWSGTFHVSVYAQ